VLIPLLGLVRTLGLLAVIAAGIGYFAVRKGHGVKKGRRQGVIAVGLLSVALALLTPVDKLASLLPGARNGTLAFYEEGRGGTVAVVTQGKGQKAFQRLYIQGVSNTGDAMPSLRYMRIQALLPLLIHNGEPRSALVIGFGTGITAGALTPLSRPRAPGRRRTAALGGQGRAVVQGQLQRSRRSRRRCKRLRDGRQELLRNPQRYDLITLEPPPPSAAGVVNLYSRDFYQLATSRLQTSRAWSRSGCRCRPRISTTHARWCAASSMFPLRQPVDQRVPRDAAGGLAGTDRTGRGENQARFQQDSVRGTLQDVGIGSAPRCLRPGSPIAPGWNASPLMRNR
jgi:spermidine synthase